MQERNALIIDKNGTIEKGNIVDTKFWEIKEGVEISNNDIISRVFVIDGENDVTGIAQHLEGLGKGDVKEVELSFTEENGIPQFTDRTVKIKIEIINIREKDIPELDDEFAQDISDNFKNLDDLKNNTKQKLLKRSDDEKKFYMLKNLYDKILENNSFELPESMVEASYRQSINNIAAQFGGGEQGLRNYFMFNGSSSPEEAMDKIRKGSVYELQVTLIKQKLFENSDVHVEDSEIDDYLEELVASNNTDKDTFLSRYKTEDELNHFKNHLKENILEKKLDDILLSQVQKTEIKEMTFSSLLEITKNFLN